jgi:hypothetical protein
LHRGSWFECTDVAGEALKMVCAAQGAYELASQMTTTLCAYPVGLFSIGSRAVSRGGNLRVGRAIVLDV